VLCTNFYGEVCVCACVVLSWQVCAGITYSIMCELLRFRDGICVYKRLWKWLSMNCKEKAGNTVELGYYVAGHYVFLGYVHFFIMCKHP
jgi:hypothetical protein